MRSCALRAIQRQLSENKTQGRLSFFAAFRFLVFSSFLSGEQTMQSEEQFHLTCTNLQIVRHHTVDRYSTAAAASEKQRKKCVCHVHCSKLCSYITQTKTLCDRQIAIQSSKRFLLWIRNKPLTEMTSDRGCRHSSMKQRMTWGDVRKGCRHNSTKRKF